MSFRDPDPYDADSRQGAGSLPTGRYPMNGRVYGTDAQGNEVTATFGYGRAYGHTFLANGHVTSEEFWDHPGHDHYGPGNGPNGYFGTGRGAYTGNGS